MFVIIVTVLRARTMRAHTFGHRIGPQYGPPNIFPRSLGRTDRKVQFSFIHGQTIMPFINLDKWGITTLHNFPQMMRLCMMNLLDSARLFLWGSEFNNPFENLSKWTNSCCNIPKTDDRGNKRRWCLLCQTILRKAEVSLIFCPSLPETRHDALRGTRFAPDKTELHTTSVYE